MVTPQSKGILFEEELADEFGLDRTPASGSTWHSKLDLTGNSFKWSLKSTTKPQWPLTWKDIVEAKEACYGLGGDGSSPIWAVRIINEDFIILRKEDFKLMQTGHIKLIEEDRPQVAARKKRASQPELLREEQ